MWVISWLWRRVNLLQPPELARKLSFQIQGRFLIQITPFIYPLCPPCTDFLYPTLTCLFFFLYVKKKKKWCDFFQSLSLFFFPLIFILFLPDSFFLSLKSKFQTVYLFIYYRFSSIHCLLCLHEFLIILRPLRSVDFPTKLFSL